ncbi:MAG: TatD family hydrolase [Sphaerochaetaceae bacterium]|nr:TatD family hydrolase [Sphaerochaetaceae bacterium]
MRYFDTHCHVGLIHDDQLEQLLAVQYAKRAGVKHIISICNSLTDFDKIYSNLRSAREVYHAVGVSPSESGNQLIGWETKIPELVKLSRVVAIGETGLDYVKNFAPKATQVELFIKHLEIARKTDLPVIIHNREAGADILDILKTKIPDKGAVFHCYSEDWNFAKQALDLPVYFSFAGNITYRNIRKLTDTVMKLPPERILIESEAPFMVPARYSKRRNKPEYLPETAKVISLLKGIDEEEMTEILYKNSLKAFHLPEEA